jgi:hypothetical protein
VGALIAARVAASLPFLFAAIGTLAAALGLAAIRLVADTLWDATVIAYRRALKNWESAYYCPADQIVFIRTPNAAHWEPVEGLRRLIGREW